MTFQVDIHVLTIGDFFKAMTQRLVLEKLKMRRWAVNRSVTKPRRPPACQQWQADLSYVSASQRFYSLCGRVYERLHMVNASLSVFSSPLAHTAGSWVDVRLQYFLLYPWSDALIFSLHHYFICQFRDVCTWIIVVVVLTSGEVVLFKRLNTAKNKRMYYL